MRPVMLWISLALAFALATVGLGWWTVPVIAASWGALRASGERPGPSTASAAAAGWALLLAWSATQAPVGELARRVGGIFGGGGPLFVTATLIFPAIVAGSAAGLASAFRGSERRSGSQKRGSQAASA